MADETADPSSGTEKDLGELEKSDLPDEVAVEDFVSDVEVIILEDAETDSR